MPTKKEANTSGSALAFEGPAISQNEFEWPLKSIPCNGRSLPSEGFVFAVNEALS